MLAGVRSVSKPQASLPRAERMKIGWRRRAFTAPIRRMSPSKMAGVWIFDWRNPSTCSETQIGGCPRKSAEEKPACQRMRFLDYRFLHLRFIAAYRESLIVRLP